MPGVDHMEYSNEETTVFICIWDMVFQQTKLLNEFKRKTD